jgi:putative isomerase
MMITNRREFLAMSSSLLGAAAIGGAAFAQSPAPVKRPSANEVVRPPTTAAANLLYAQIGDESWTDLYGRLWAVNADIRTNGLRQIPGVKETLLTGYPYNEFYDWDLYFENLYLSYYGVWPYCFTNLKEFLDREQPDGYVNRSLIKQRDRQQFKPFLAQLVVLGAKQNKNDYEWVRGNYYGRLKKYLDKWFSYDADENGLPVWNSADAAGTDNQFSRAGQIGAFDIEGVDLASYLVRELRAMAIIADRLNMKPDVREFSDHADHVVRLINDTLWNEQDGMYYDRNEKTGEAVKVKSATCFMPLFAGAATPDHARRTIEMHLTNPKEFWLAYPVASYAKTEPDYYQGSLNKECNWRGSTWAPTNYMIFQGLMRYGFVDEAKDLATRLFDMAVVKNPVLREYYNAETGEGLGQTRFWGFTSLYYGMLLECDLKYDASDLEKKSRPIITDELGIRFQA